MNDNSREENYFVSMTDMMVGILFVFIIMVAFFAFQIQTDESVPKVQHEAKVKELQAEITNLEAIVKMLRERIKELESEIKRLLQLIEAANEYETYSVGAANKREEIILNIVEKLQTQGIVATANVAQGVITIPGDTLFASGSSDLTQMAGSLNRVQKLAEIVDQEISCYALQLDKLLIDLSCNPKGVLIETIFIEGHTDSIPVSTTLRDGSRTNLELSARRATNSYEAMSSFNQNLVQYKNPFGQQILSVSAFGSQRPVASNQTAAGREQNRRIDIRFLMFMPVDLEDLEQFRATYGIK